MLEADHRHVGGGSLPTTRASKLRPSASCTFTSSAPATTWLLVRMMPALVEDEARAEALLASAAAGARGPSETLAQYLGPGVLPVSAPNESSCSGW